jgi:DeoR/GlpR family transcriptional regulator of sugar metabolism
MDSKTRRATIAERLRVDGEASIIDLAELFGTSAMTIRRDLEILEGDGLARRARGGAISVQSRSFEPPILQRAAHEAEAKRRIGIAAAELVRENETVVLDVGTTVQEMAKALREDLVLTAITSSLLIATELATKPRVRTIVTGGVVRHGEMSLVGPRARASFDDLNCDAVFARPDRVQPRRRRREAGRDGGRTAQDRAGRRQQARSGGAGDLRPGQ